MTEHEHAFTAEERKQYGRLRVVFLVVSVFSVVEYVGARIARSDVLRAENVHLVMDVLALFVSLFAMKVAVRKPTAHFTYGLRRAEPVAGFFNAVLVLVAAAHIAFESFEHMTTGEPPARNLMLAFSLIALVVNGLSAWLIHGSMSHDHPGHSHGHGLTHHGPSHDHDHQHAPGHDAHAHDDHDCATETEKDKEWEREEKRAHQLNLRGAWLHLVGDTLASLAAVVAAVVIRLGGPRIIDPLASLAVVAILVVGAFRLLRDALWVLLEAAPKHIRLEDLDKRVRAVAGVTDVADLHVWTVGGHHDAITLRVVAPAAAPGLAHEISAVLRHEFDAKFVTVQVDAALVPSAPLR